MTSKSRSDTNQRGMLYSSLVRAHPDSYQLDIPEGPLIPPDSDILPDRCLQILYVRRVEGM